MEISQNFVAFSVYMNFKIREYSEFGNSWNHVVNSNAAAIQKNGSTLPAEMFGGSACFMK